MRKFLYIKYNKIFKDEKPMKAAIKAAKFTFFTKSIKSTSISIKIKDIETMKFYNYIAYKTDNNKINIKSKLKKIGGNNFKHLDRVVLYDTINKGYITQYDKNEIANPYYYKDRNEYSKMYKLSNKITKNSIFEIYKNNNLYSFSLQYPNDKYHYFVNHYISFTDSNNNIYNGYKSYLSKDGTYYYLDNNIIRFQNKTPIIEVHKIIPTIKELRDRETGIKKL